MLGARISGLDDYAHRLLIEAFEPAFALEVFEVAAYGALFHKFVELGLVDEAGFQQALGAIVLHGPALALGEGLFQKWKI